MLAYSLKYGDKNLKIIAAAQEKGDPIPDELIPPELDVCNEFYMKAINELDTERPRGECGIGSIPWSKIKEYAEVYFDTFEDYEMFSEIIMTVDRYWVSEVNKKNRREIERKTASIRKGK